MVERHRLMVSPVLMLRHCATWKKRKRCRAEKESAEKLHHDRILLGRTLKSHRHDPCHDHKGPASADNITRKQLRPALLLPCSQMQHSSTLISAPEFTLYQRRPVAKRLRSIMVIERFASLRQPSRSSVFRLRLTTSRAVPTSTAISSCVIETTPRRSALSAR